MDDSLDPSSQVGFERETKKNIRYLLDRVDSLSFPSSTAGFVGWDFVRGKRLEAASDSIVVEGLPACRYLKVIYSLWSVGGTILGGIRFNGDANNNYSYTYSQAYAAGASATSQPYMSATAATTSQGLHFASMEVLNVETKRKIMQGTGLNDNNAGATSGLNMIDFGGKWNNTTDFIDRVDVINFGTGDLDVGSELVVLGKNWIS